MKAVVIDTEATQLDNPEPIQIAYLPMKLYRTTKPYLTITPQAVAFNQMFKPEHPITAGAMAVHHITNKDVAKCEPSSSFTLPDQTQYIIGHNVDFDAKSIGDDQRKRICTLAMCRSFFPEWGSHTLGASLIELYGEEQGLKILGNAHDAANDTLSCAYLLHALIDKVGKPIASFEQLYRISEKARIPKLMAFGKHKGEPVGDVPHTYRSWYKKQDDCDPYLLKAWGL